VGDDEASPMEMAQQDEQEGLRELDEASAQRAAAARLIAGSDVLDEHGYETAATIGRMAAFDKLQTATTNIMQAVDLGTASGEWTAVADDLNQQAKVEAEAVAADARADKAEDLLRSESLSESDREIGGAEAANERAAEKALLRRAQKLGDEAKAAEEAARMHERTARKRDQ
jgi:hypothetical protein